ncbi:MAG: DUF4249 domain-containing protein [Bacteroidales bacterium]|nr:DUF4249 domain-containing protein [Bacteroidales bacterium]MCF8456375.1 DUF4249 domain-containing protein [Bacteroidales bacterium]
MKTNRIFLLILVAIGFTFCTERIDVDIDRMEFARLVVDGTLSTDTTIHTIKLTQTTDYFENQPAPVVSGANVYISADDGETIQFTEEESSGFYHSQADVFGVIGKTYTLHIDLAEEVGGHKNYISLDQEMKPVAELDSIKLKYEPDWDKGYWTIMVYAWEPETEDFYRFMAYRNGVLLTDTIDEFVVQEDVFFNGNYTNGIQSQFLDTKKEEANLQLGDTITFEINGITEEYYHFVLEIQAAIWGSDPMFSGPPANVSSNMNNGALGFFSVYSSQKASVILTEMPE